MATIKIILRKDKINKKIGVAPLYIRITQNRKSKFVALGIKIEPKYWDNEKSIIKRGATNYKELNAYILQKRAEVERTSLELGAKLEHVSSLNIKEKIQRKKKAVFFNYTEQKLEELRTNMTFSTYNEYKIRLGKFRKYCNGRELNFSDIDSAFVKAYEKHQMKVLNNKSYTVLNNFKFLKTMFNHAIKDGVIDGGTHVFRNLEIKTGTPVIKYLTEEQFQRLIDFDSNKLQDPIYLDLFIFSCYAGGLRISDAVSLKWKDYLGEEERIVKTILKTKRKHQIKLPKRANDIINKYKPETFTPEDYVFPLLKHIEGEVVSEQLRNNRVKNHNYKANEVLKIISEKLNLSYKLTFHSSRHTFATLALNRGMRIEYVSKILDHTNINITQVYAKVVNKELDKAMDIMND